MPGVSRAGVDSAGGTILGGVSSVLINGAPCAVLGNSIVPHNPRNSKNPTPHEVSPRMVGSSSTVFAGGIAVCRAGDSASCGHSATGSGNVSAG